jgi:hypothetical protein
LTIFVLSYFLSWLIFALLWYVIAYAHGDLEFDAEGNRLGEGRQECVRGATSFAGFFLLSIETQVSTGFGERYRIFYLYRIGIENDIAFTFLGILPKSAQKLYFS